MLRKSLATLPPTLDETYDRILCAIYKDYSAYVARILQLLVFSSRQLLVDEISEIIAIDIERDPAFDPDEVLEDPLDVLKICTSLVTIAMLDNHYPSNQVVLLAHYSVKEYLVSERCCHSPAARFSMQPTSSNEFIARSCLAYLLQFQDTDSFSCECIEKSKLALYTAQYWISHVQAGPEKATLLNELIMQLFSTTGEAYLNWIRICDPDIPWREPDVIN